MSEIVTEVKEFFLNLDVVKFAIAVVFSQTFYPVIQSFVNEIILPFFGAIFFKINSNIFKVSLNGAVIDFGSLLSNAIIFILSMFVLFFVFIKPLTPIIDEVEKELENDKK